MLQLAMNWPALFGILGIALFVGILSGAYPAFVLSSFRPVAVIGGMMRSGRKHGGIRKMLVVAQFTTSIALLICTGIVSDQLYHLRNKHLGLNPEQLIVFPMTSGPIKTKFPAYKREIQQQPGVLGVTVSNVAPGLLNSLFSVIFQAQEASNAEPLELSTLVVDPNYVEVMGMEIAAGRFFLQEQSESSADQLYVINETAVRQFGWDSPEEAVGQRLYWLQEGDVTRRFPGTIVGVIKDFHIRSLHDPIEAVVLLRNKWGAYGLVKIATADMAGTLASLRQTWQKVQGQAPFEYRFMDEAFARLYDAEEQIGKVFGGFALIAVIIGCLGLFGLSSFTVTRRTREIGIRKVLGASIPNIIRLISKEFLTLVLLANILAWPLAYYAMAWWLQNFAYRIDIGIVTFLLAGIVAMVAIPD